MKSKILIVLDDRARCEALAEILEEAGHFTKVIQTTADLFSILPQIGPHIVLIDMTMPAISTIVTRIVVRRLAEVTTTKVLVITQDAQSAKSIWKAAVVLTSPVSPDRLLKMVSAYL